jgi:hypothetical protein
MGALIKVLVQLFVVLPIRFMVLCLHLFVVWPLKAVGGGAKVLAFAGRVLLAPFRFLLWLFMLPVRLLTWPVRVVL